MEIRVGITNAPSEVQIEMADDTKIDDVKAQIEAAITAESMVWLVDRKGREVGFPAAKLAYIACGTRSDENRIGFS